MKTMIVTLTTLALLGGSTQPVSAGDREWATAGKVLTGLVAGGVLLKALESSPVYYQAPTYYVPPVVQVAPAPTVYVQPAPVYVQPAPVYVQPAPVAVQPAPVVVHPVPVIVQPAPVYIQPAPVYRVPVPVVSFHFGFGGHRHHPPVVRICR